MTSPACDEVFVISDGKIYRRQITTGANDGIFIEIVLRLHQSELVVTSGTEYLQDGMKVDFTLEGDDNIG